MYNQSYKLNKLRAWDIEASLGCVVCTTSLSYIKHVEIHIRYRKQDSTKKKEHSYDIAVAVACIALMKTNHITTRKFPQGPAMWSQSAVTCHANIHLEDECCCGKSLLNINVSNVSKDKSEFTAE